MAIAMVQNVVAENAELMVKLAAKDRKIQTQNQHIRLQEDLLKLARQQHFGKNTNCWARCSILCSGKSIILLTFTPKPL
ncbi:hypothetical protein C2O87_21415 [Salmonella enterica]|nr:hypothetical protein [Salmonella enterica]